MGLDNLKSFGIFLDEQTARIKRLGKTTNHAIGPKRSTDEAGRRKVWVYINGRTKAEAYQQGKRG